MWRVQLWSCWSCQGERKRVAFVLTYSESLWTRLQLVYAHYEKVELTLPYIPSYLAFREAPHLMKLIDKLRTEAPQYVPQVIFVDGNGILHPRGCGLATHLGLVQQLSFE